MCVCIHSKQCQRKHHTSVLNCHESCLTKLLSEKICVWHSKTVYLKYFIAFIYLCVQRCTYYGALVKLTGLLTESILSFHPAALGLELRLSGLSTGVFTHEASHGLVHFYFVQCIMYNTGSKLHKMYHCT